MTTEKIDLADLDVIFLTYDEPNKEANWIAIQNMVPWARRVDGVKGSDAAHKAAAALSKTNRFILIDGDNIPDVEFFDLQLELDDLNRDCVFRWKARNAINGLMYGNGGISCWTKHFVNNMQTHENSDGSAETLVEFCFNPRYIAMHDCYSTTYPNHSAFQAWRAGFREGVKMCLDRGRKPSIEEFNRAVHKRNYDNLCIWQTVGADVEYGQNAIEGARLGTWLTMLQDWDYTKVQDFDELKKIYDQYSDCIMDTGTWKVTEQLQNRLGLPIMNLSAEQSKFFKHHYRTQFKNKGIMTYESN